MAGGCSPLLWRGVGGEVMIVVIADDITGAAELGGIGLRFGLRVLLSDHVVDSADIDLLVIYSNTRSLPEGKATETMSSLAKEVKDLFPSLFYKKIDSVLRGHVMAETITQMKVFGYEKALLVPVNPLLGRTISNGTYYLHGQPIHETGFSSDPEFPVYSSDVKQMLKNQALIATHNGLLQNGITIGEAITPGDVEEWAKHQSENVLLGGAASFFYALLEKNYQRITNDNKVSLSSPVLLVSGTTYRNSIDQRKKFEHLVTDMPSPVYLDETAGEIEIENWADEAVAILSKNKGAIVAIGEHEGKSDPNLLAAKLAEVVKKITERTGIAELLIEGGSTAFSIIQKLSFSSFIPMEELQQGVVRMKVVGQESLHLTIKPGSYEWPEEWNFN